MVTTPWILTIATWMTSLSGLLPPLMFQLSSQSAAQPASQQASTTQTPKQLIRLAQATPQVDPAIATLEQAVLQQINQYRSQKQLSPLTLDNTISQQARLHSQTMASSGVLSHQGFNQRVEAIAQSISYRAAAENVAFNQGYRDPVKQAVQGWISSPGHRRNIEGQYDLTGIGVAQNEQGEYYFTQVFIRRG